ncbi:MAG TPA: cytochrome-c oxidase, cbb3-type subunit III [Gemmatimonadaceae bacterium]|jgi:cytochrome c oxidase cbb3-type subunit 3
MSDFVTGGWSFFVAIATIVSILACGAFLYALGRMRVARKTGDETVGTTGHVWDGDLAEYNNPLPRWWMWLFYLTIAFSIVYLILYPGLGSLPGILSWTSTGAYTAEVSDVDAKVAPIYARYKEMDVRAIAAQPEARAIGERLFLNYCAQCHGSDAAGSKGFPNLTDRDWLYGGDPERIRQSITDGRNGVMPRFGPVLGDEGVRNVVAYVRSLSGLPSDSVRAFQGKALFLQNCSACHGADGKGNQDIGAPNLTDQIWLYGSTEAAITETVTKGRGQASAVTRMPAHRDRLDEAKIKLLAAYVWGFSNGK